MENLKIKESMGKREITNMTNKISKKLIEVNDMDKLLEFISSNYDVIDLDIEKNSDDVSLSFIIPKTYIGSIDKKTCFELNEDFGKIELLEAPFFCITKEEHMFNICVSVRITYCDKWGNEYNEEVNIKNNTFDIPLDVRKDKLNFIQKEIVGLSSGTISKLIADENVSNDASCMYSLIDEVQKRFLDYTMKKIYETNKIPSTWQDAWNSFSYNVDIKSMAYELGIDKSKIEINYDLIKDCEAKIVDIKNSFDILSCEDDILNLPKEALKKLSYVYGLTVLKRHCMNDNYEAIKKVKEQTIPKILNGEYDDEFYHKNAIRGLKVLKKY